MRGKCVAPKVSLASVLPYGRAWGVLRYRVQSLRFAGVVVLTIVLVLSSLVPVLSAAKADALEAADGGIFTFGDAAFYGSTGGLTLNKPIVGMATTPDGKGYWLVASDGGLFTYGDAGFYGSAGGLTLNRPMVGMATTPDGKGYWLVASDGGIFTYGDAGFYGSTGGLILNRPIVGMATTPDGKGYWLVASDGGIFSYGDAAFYGSAGGLTLNKPIVGMATTPDGKGYWLVASDGGIFTYGDAGFYGSTGGLTLNRPMVGMATTPDGKGYWLVASDGGIFTYGDAAYYGSAGGSALTQDVVGMAATPDGKGYWLVASNGEMPAPPGYTAQQLIFDDQFSGTSLDTTKWNTFLGDQGLVWNDNGNLPAPYSGPNVPGAGSEAQMFGPSQVGVDNGLTLTAQRNTNAYAATYPWISGVVTTEGKFSLPTGGWYVQVKAKMPDQSQGMWPGLWFLPGVPGAAASELDGYEGGLLGNSPDNEQGHSVYFTNQGVQLGGLWSTGADVSAGYHVYGVQFIPGHSITTYFDGRQVWQLKTSSAAPLAAEPYEIILSLQVATEATSPWHSVTTGDTPSATMNVAEVQAYSYP